jgi:hypothetical protein
MQATSITYKEALGLWTVALSEGAGGRGCRQVLDPIILSSLRSRTYEVGGS